MFKEYLIVNPYPTVTGEAARQLKNKYEILIKDTEFEEAIEAEVTVGGLDVITPLVKLYEAKQANVAANIAAFCIYSAKRFNIDPSMYFKRVKYLNACYQTYEKDIEKYLQLL